MGLFPRELQSRTTSMLLYKSLVPHVGLQANLPVWQARTPCYPGAKIGWELSPENADGADGLRETIAPRAICCKQASGCFVPNRTKCRPAPPRNISIQNWRGHFRARCELMATQKTSLEASLAARPAGFIGCFFGCQCSPEFHKEAQRPVYSQERGIYSN